MTALRIGSGSAWWGDRIEPARRNAEEGNLDYLCFETMAEATVSAAQVRKRRDPSFPGYDTYLDDRMRAVLPGCIRRGTKIITNQGYFYLLLVLLVATVAVLHLLDTSRTGRAWRAVREDPLAAGMILSDEPGFYETGAYGIRLENLLLVRPAPFPEGKKPFLCFEVLTLAPFDRRLIEPDLLTAEERSWMEAYHARVLAEIGPWLDHSARSWLERACAPLP